MSLMDQVSRTEKDIAATLRALDGTDGSEATARRLKLAEEAVKGARDAAERGVQLQRQADRWASRRDVAALLQSQHRAGRVLADLARAEKDMAATLMRMASRADPDRAARLRHLAQEALADAQRAGDRARSLHDLAVSEARRHHQPPHDA